MPAPHIFTSPDVYTIATYASVKTQTAEAFVTYIATYYEDESVVPITLASGCAYGADAYAASIIAARYCAEALSPLARKALQAKPEAIIDMSLEVIEPLASKICGCGILAPFMLNPLREEAERMPLGQRGDLLAIARALEEAMKLGTVLVTIAEPEGIA